MMPLDHQFQNTLVDHEGMKRYAYTDSRGFLTIGIGRCIDPKSTNGLSLNEMMYLLNNDITEARGILASHPFYIVQDDVRKDLLTEMVFNMGIGNLLQFDCIKDGWMQDKNYKDSLTDFRRSKWAEEIGQHRLDNMMYRLEHGEYPPK